MSYTCNCGDYIENLNNTIIEKDNIIRDLEEKLHNNILLCDARLIKIMRLEKENKSIDLSTLDAELVIENIQDLWQANRSMGKKIDVLWNRLKDKK